MLISSRFMLWMLAVSSPGSVSASGAHFAETFDEGRLDFTVQVREVTTAFKVMGIFAEAGERIPISQVSGEGTMKIDAGMVAVSSDRASQKNSEMKPIRWEIQAPEVAGWYPIDIYQDSTGQRMRLNLFVKQKLAKVGDRVVLGDYRVGNYPNQRFRNLAEYAAPTSLFAVTPDLLNKHVSPHFTLGQFLCKQAGQFPKAVVVSEQLVHKLEVLLTRINTAGIRADSLEIMSGFRTPFYNQEILGNGKYSRHQWGDAADVYVDVAPKDGVMDDLNKDGQTDYRDAKVLLDLIDSMDEETEDGVSVGGASPYRANAAHGPFLHIDARGYRARW